MRVIELTYFEWGYLEQALHPTQRILDKDGVLVMPGGELGFKRVRELSGPSTEDSIWIKQQPV